MPRKEDGKRVESEEKSGESERKGLSIDEIREIIRQELKLKKEKRVYRRRHELPDPSKPASATVNRLPRSKKPTSIRLDGRLLDIVNEAAKKAGYDRTTWMSRAFVLAALHDGIEVPDDLLELVGGAVAPDDP